MVSRQLCGGRTSRKSRRKNIARKLSMYLLVLGAPPAPPPPPPQFMSIKDS